MTTQNNSRKLQYVHSEPERKNRGQIVIAHISDLHFTSITDIEDHIWTSLHKDLRSKKVDFLAATGDLVDSSFRDNLKSSRLNLAFNKVHEFLKELCKSLNIDPNCALGVVPGNHDFRVQGIISPYSKYKYLRSIKQRLTNTHYDEFYNHFRRQYQPKLLPSLRCCIFPFDSNTLSFGINFASGKIKNEDIVIFSDVYEEMKKRTPDWAIYNKIALIHHHPMPIAATEVNPSFIDSEDYHLLKNAGLFMTEMVKHDIDLILHGHKHYAALSKAAFPIENGNFHTVNVIAAGSISRGKPYNSYNLITIHDNGEIEVEKRICEKVTYSSGGKNYVVNNGETRPLRLGKLASKERVTIQAKRYKRIAIIDKSGDIQNIEEYENLTSYTGVPIESIHSSYSSQLGYNYTPKFEQSSSLHVSWNWKDRTKGIGMIMFAPPIGTDPVSFQIETQTLNAFCFNQRDRFYVTGNNDNVNESIRAKVRQKLDVLILKTVFPHKNVAKHIRVQVFDEDNKPDYSEERYASTRIMTFRDEPSAVLLIEKPLPGYTYKIVWELPANEVDAISLEHHDIKFADEIIKRLLNLRNKRSTNLPDVEQSLHNLKGRINSSKGTEADMSADDLEILLHVFDKQNRCLVCVAAIDTETQKHRLLKQSIGFGRTIIGQAYKRRERMSYISDDNVDNAEFFDFDNGYIGILSIPIFHPLKVTNGIGRRVGVLTLATRLNTAPFLKAFERGSFRDSEPIKSTLERQMANWWAPSLLKALRLLKK